MSWIAIKHVYTEVFEFYCVRSNFISSNDHSIFPVADVFLFRGLPLFDDYLMKSDHHCLRFSFLKNLNNRKRKDNNKYFNQLAR